MTENSVKKSNKANLIDKEYVNHFVEIFKAQYINISVQVLGKRRQLPTVYILPPEVDNFLISFLNKRLYFTVEESQATGLFRIT